MIENYYEIKLHFKSAVTAEHQDRPVLTLFFNIKISFKKISKALTHFAQTAPHMNFQPHSITVSVCLVITANSVLVQIWSTWFLSLHILPELIT